MIGCQEHTFLALTADQYRLLEDNEPTRVTLVPPKFGVQKIGGTNLVAKSAPHPACRISNDANKSLRNVERKEIFKNHSNIVKANLNYKGGTERKDKKCHKHFSL